MGPGRSPAGYRDPYQPSGAYEGVPSWREQDERPCGHGHRIGSARRCWDGSPWPAWCGRASAGRGHVRGTIWPARRPPGRAAGWLRGSIAYWRDAGYLATGRLGAGPVWCRLTTSNVAGEHW